MDTLVLENVKYKYENSKKYVLKDVKAKFNSGKFYSIIGKSGSGKSTLLSLIAGLDTCTDGKILYKDKDLKEIDRDRYRSNSIGVIFQGFNLLTNISAVDNIVLSMEISKVNIKDKKEYAYKLLERVLIDKEKADRKILELSGGEQQRIAIARALSHNPDVIIADEPSGNLDKDTEEIIMNLLKELASKEKKCVIVVTHSNKVTTYADEVWSINSGNLLYVK